MKKLIYGIVFLMLLVSIAGFAIAQSGSDNNQTDDNSNDLNETNDSGNDSASDLNESDDSATDSDNDLNESNSSGKFGDKLREKINDKGMEVRYEFRNGTDRIEYRLDMRKGELREELREKMKDRLSEIRLKIRDRNVSFNYTDDDKLEFIVGKINTRTGLNLTIDQIDNVSLGQVLRAYLSNGRWAEVKVMPDTASEIALKKLRAKCEDRNCTVELKEMHNNQTNQTRLAYQLNTEKDSKLFFLFKKKMKMVAEVDAETGDIISTRKPWWSFMAKEDNTSDKEIEDETNDSGNNSTVTNSSG